ncbi:phage tail protein [Echinimonas agarilytica]|uniref:Tail fiber protein n=1 Tax=Echinimonas agarilytica TaxID=1215918 RepID=A0AA42B5W5_9GAMM|nr:tail fiber protein [Echinimonas agarilytica]MCM2678142.1 tail fiber protein [Echinimonas agarilytica]
MKRLLNRIPLKWRAGLLSLSALPLAFIPQQANACSYEPMIGGMCVFAGSFAPRNWALAHGQLMPISSHSAMFSILGTMYGGDGRTTFALPDTRGRAVIGTGRGPGSQFNYRPGNKAGADTVALSTFEMPAHTHSATTTIGQFTFNADATLHASTATNSTGDPSGNALGTVDRGNIYTTGTPSVAMSSDSINVTVSGSPTSAPQTTIGSQGGSVPHENRMPFISMNWIIAIEGIYPSRS